MEKQEYALTTRGNLSNNLPYLPTEYSVKPGLKKLEDEPHFIIDEWYPDYRNEKMDARRENIDKYYIEQTASMSGDIYATKLNQDGSHVWTTT